MRARWLAATLAGLMVSACGGNPVTPQIAAPVLAPVVRAPAAAETLSRAAALVSEQRGYNFSFELTLSGLPEANGTPLAAGSGSSNHEQRRSSVKLNLAGLVSAARLAGESAADFEAMLGDGTIDLIQDGATVYVKMPFLTREAGISTPWVSLVMPDTPNRGSEPLPGLFGQLGATGSPGAYLAQLKAIDASVVEDGKGIVRGIEITRYRGTWDLATLLGQGVPASEASQFEAMRPFIEALKLPYEVWVDAEGLPRRLTTTLDFRTFAPPGTPPGEPVPALTFTYDLFDFGSPAPIDVPDGSQVTALDPSVLTALR